MSDGFWFGRGGYATAAKPIPCPIHKVLEKRYNKYVSPCPYDVIPNSLYCQYHTTNKCICLCSADGCQTIFFSPTPDLFCNECGCKFCDADKACQAHECPQCRGFKEKSSHSVCIACACSVGGCGNIPFKKTDYCIKHTAVCKECYATIAQGPSVHNLPPYCKDCQCPYEGGCPNPLPCNMHVCGSCGGPKPHTVDLCIKCRCFLKSCRNIKYTSYDACLDHLAFCGKCGDVRYQGPEPDIFITGDGKLCKKCKCCVPTCYKEKTNAWTCQVHECKTCVGIRTVYGDAGPAFCIKQKKQKDIPIHCHFTWHPFCPHGPNVYKCQSRLLDGYNREKCKGLVHDTSGLLLKLCDPCISTNKCNTHLCRSIKDPNNDGKCRMCATQHTCINPACREKYTGHIANRLCSACVHVRDVSVCRDCGVMGKASDFQFINQQCCAYCYDLRAINNIIHLYARWRRYGYMFHRWLKIVAIEYQRPTHEVLSVICFVDQFTQCKGSKELSEVFKYFLDSELKKPDSPPILIAGTTLEFVVRLSLLPKDVWEMVLNYM